MAFLFFVALTVIIWALVGFVRSPYTPFQTILFFLCVLLTRVLWRAKIPRRLPIGDRQGAVLISNHRSSIDPFFYQTIAGRPIHWMVTRDAVESAAFGWFLRACEVIPVGRGGIDVASTKTAIRLASQGGVIGMFPEGRINMTDQFMMKVRPGALLIALKAQVVVVPCYVQGSPYGGTPATPFVMPAKVTVKFGRPLDLSEFYGREREDGVLPYVTKYCIKEIARLADVEFEPQLAGRDWKPDEEELNALMAAQAKRM